MDFCFFVYIKNKKNSYSILSNIERGISMVEISILICTVIGLATAFKKLGINKKFIPIINVILGVSTSFIFIEGNWREITITGLLIGLSASGLFDQTKVMDFLKR